MSKRPAYLKNKSNSYWIISALLAVLVWVIYGYSSSEIELQQLVNKSELYGRTFQGRVEEIYLPEDKISTYFMEEHTTPLVAVSFIFDKAGSAYDAKDKQGLATMVASTIEYGTKGINADDLRDKLALNGIKISFNAEKDIFSGLMMAPKQNIMQAAEVLRLMLTEPKFEKKYVENTKAQVLQALAVEKENPLKELSVKFNEKIYGDYPYGYNPLGKKETVLSIDHNDLQDFVKNRFSKDNLFVGVAGDMNGQEAVNLVKQIFGNLPQTTKLSRLESPEIDWQQSILKIERKDGQNAFVFAAPSTCRKCEDFYPLYMANYLFGGAGLNSRINQTLREQEGLTYGGYSALTINDKANLIMGSFSATKDKYNKAKNMFLEEWKKVAKEGFSKDELQKAKDYLTSSYNLRFASIGQIAEMLAYMQKYDLGKDFLQKRNGYVENVSLQQLNEAAKKYFGKEMLQAEIGDFE